MQCPGHGQAEYRDIGFEFVAVVGAHLIAALHRTDRGVEHGAAGVAEVFARLQVRLLAHDAGALYLLHRAVAVGDDPVARQQLGRHAAGVADGDGIGEYVAPFIRQ